MFHFKVIGLQYIHNSVYGSKVTAVDADDSEFGRVRYSLSDGFDREDQRPLFHINPVTGEICVDQDIDRDAGLVTYDLQIKAEDQVR